MNVSQFAKLMGVSQPVVSKACKTGRLDASVRRDTAGRVVDIDPVSGAAEWRAHAARLAPKASQQAPGGAAPPGAPGDDPVSLLEARARRETALAGIAEIALGRARGSLVDARELEQRLVDVFTRSRNKLLGVPSKLKQQCPHLTIAEVATVDALIRETLEELADGIAKGGVL